MHLPWTYGILRIKHIVSHIFSHIKVIWVWERRVWHSQYLFGPLDMSSCWCLIPESTLYCTARLLLPKQLLLNSCLCSTSCRRDPFIISFVLKPWILNTLQSLAYNVPNMLSVTLLAHFSNSKTCRRSACKNKLCVLWHYIFNIFAFGWTKQTVWKCHYQL